MKYYTYLHRRKDNNEIFYIGQGCNRRAFRQYHHDNKDWHSVADVVGYTIEIIDHHKTKGEAINAEYKLLQQYKNSPWLVNRNKGNNQPCIAGPYYQRKTNRIIRKSKLTPQERGYTLLYDIWVDLKEYNARLKTDPVTGCLEVYRGGLHSQGYMMISVLSDPDLSRIMTVGARIAGRIKAGRALTSEDFVIKICGNCKCHNLDHLIIGDGKLKSDIRQINNAQPVFRPEERARRRYDRPDVPLASEVTYVINHSTEDSMARFGWTKTQVNGIKYQHTRGRYKWLEHFDYVTDEVKPEWAWLYAKK